MDFATTFNNLFHQMAFFNLTIGNFAMIGVAFVFLLLAIKYGFEPLLLIPIAFGMLQVNIYPEIMASPEETSNGVGGLLHYFFILDEWSILPSLIFMGVGAMTDFGPLIANPKSFLLGAAAQFGILIRQYLRLAASDSGMSLHKLMQSCIPSGRRRYVGIEQYCIWIGSADFQGFVVPFGKPVVGVECNDTYAGTIIIA